MLPKPFKLPYQETALLKKTGQRLRTGSLELIYQKTPDTAWRFMVFVPKRVVKLATSRNRLKRIIYEQIRLQTTHLVGGGKALLKLTRVKPEEETLRDLKEVLEKSIKIA